MAETGRGGCAGRVSAFSETEDGRFTAQAISVSLHHAPEADWLELRQHAQAAVAEALGRSAVGGMPELTVNAAGMFLCGGPTGDNGTTGKKLVLDAYGPAVPIGGGAWSGKDFHKPDRVGGMLARRLALQCVRAGLGRRVRVQLDYRPNSARPESVEVWADGRRAALPCSAPVMPTQDAARRIMESLRAADFEPLVAGTFARWGHFGAGAATPWWEALD